MIDFDTLEHEEYAEIMASIFNVLDEFQGGVFDPRMVIFIASEMLHKTFTFEAERGNFVDLEQLADLFNTIRDCTIEDIKKLIN